MAIKPSSYITGILIMTLFVIGGVSMMAEFRKVDPTFARDKEFGSFNNTFNIYVNVSERVGNISSSLENADSDAGLFGVLNSLIMNSWTTLRYLVSSFDFMDGLFKQGALLFGIPKFIPAIIISVITVMIVFAIWGAIFQREL